MALFLVTEALWTYVPIIDIDSFYLHIFTPPVFLIHNFSFLCLKQEYASSIFFDSSLLVLLYLLYSLPFFSFSLLPTHREIICWCLNRFNMISMLLEILLAWWSLYAKFVIINVAWMHWSVLYFFLSLFHFSLLWIFYISLLYVFNHHIRSGLHCRLNESALQAYSFNRNFKTFSSSFLLRIHIF